MVVLLRPNKEIPEDLICPICMSVPSEPCYLEPCDHFFCVECAQQALSRTPSCPVDRIACTPTQICRVRENSLVHRIWSSILVKCEHVESGCSWTGSIADYKKHMTSCTRGRPSSTELRRSDSDEALIQNLSQQKEELRTEVIQLQVEKRQLMRERYSLELALALVIRTPKIKPSGAYDYERNNVVELTQLICQHLESKPDGINANKTFDCIRNIYRDFKRGFEDNPDHFEADVRMLLAVCLASTWFTFRQIGNISTWASEQHWL